jgi:hypothetical protein
LNLANDPQAKQQVQLAVAAIINNQIDANNEDEKMLPENRAQAKVFAAAAECVALSHK